MRIRFFLFFLLLFLFFIFLGFFYWQRNIYSKEVLKLEILGPNEIISGQEVEYIVKYKNNGNFRLEEPELIIEFPENCIQEEKIVKREIIKEDKIGLAIYPGEENSFPFKLKLFGKEGELKTIKASLSFRPKNLKAKYSANTSFTSQVKSVPITFEFDLPSKVEAGKILNFHLDYFSNLDFPLTDLRIKIEYPKDFEFLESKPGAIENVEWEIPVLNKLEGGRIEISGKMLGEIGRVQIFKAKIGILKEGNFILLKEIEKGVETIKPSIFLRQEINGNPEYVATLGEWLHYVIYFKNIGSDELANLFLIVKLEGEAYDFQTLKTDVGECRTGEDFCVFDWKKIPKLQYLAPTEEGKVDFWIRLKDDLGAISNPVLKNKVFISQLKEEFITKISSKLEVVQKGFYYDEVFGNSGPLPPRVGVPTTYTILWQVKNYYSKVENVKVKAKLPENVSLTGKIFPQEAALKFSFDPTSREVVWSVGDLEGGKGISISPQSVAFQVSFLPKKEDIGKTPEIISEVKVSGEDSWTKKILENNSPAIHTNLPDDPAIQSELGIVE